MIGRIDPQVGEIARVIAGEYKDTEAEVIRRVVVEGLGECVDLMGYGRFLLEGVERVPPMREVLGDLLELDKVYGFRHYSERAGEVFRIIEERAGRDADFYQCPTCKGWFNTQTTSRDCPNHLR